MPPPVLSRAKSSSSQHSFEEDDLLCDDDDPSDSQGPSLSSKRDAVIFSTHKELSDMEEKMVAEAVECTGVPEEDAFLMLRSHGWDVAVFNEAYFEDPVAARKRARVSEENDEPATSSSCGICFCSPGERMLPCEGRPLLAKGKKKREPHQSFCCDCWRLYVEHAVQEGKGCLDLCCPAPGCNEAVRRSVFMRFLNGENLARYQRFVAESYVDDSHGRVRWCPGQLCGRAAMQPASGLEVACPCGTTWCFGCGTDAHLPVSCEIVKKWEAKNRDEGEDATWIKVNTKFCPKCQNSIEKNGGCMHMTCRKPGGCGHEFCWLCMKNWNGHQSCNVVEDQGESLRLAAEKSELMRYARYYERFMEHQKAERFAAKEQAQTIEFVASTVLEVHRHQVRDVKFLSDAVLQIRDGRRFLKWTYAHGFFANYTADKAKFFTFHQAQLEGTLERLSDIMENTSWDSFLDESMVSNRPFYDFRSTVISLTGVVAELFGNLQKALEQGILFG